MSEYTTAQLADRWYDRRDVTNLAGKYVTSLLIKKEGTVFETFWAKADDVSLTFNDGRYTGREAVFTYYASVAEATKVKSQFIKKLFPEKLGDLSDDKLFGVGQLKALPLTTPVIEIAGDGKTAKGIWNVQGSDNDVTAYGPLSLWSVGYLCIDFLKEDDDWKIWHLSYLEDLKTPMGESWVTPAAHTPDPAFAEIANIQLAPYTEEKTFYQAYHATRPFTPPPELPVPYETFADTFSY